MQTAAAGGGGGSRAPRKQGSPMKALSADIQRIHELNRIEHEAKQNYATLKQQLDNVSMRIYAEQVQAARVEEAMKALSEAGPQCVAYRSIARLFVLTPPKQLEKQLTQERQQLQQKDLPKLQALKKQLVARLCSIMAQRRELREEYETIMSGNSRGAFGSDSEFAVTQEEREELAEDSKRDA